jgi:thiol:disulfide interchange protein
LLERTGVQYPTGYDPEGKVARSYGVYGMPVTVFISPDGRELARHQGRLTRRQLEDNVRRLFG